MQSMEGLELVLQLQLPRGEVEQILVGATMDGIAVLMKMLPMKKKYQLPEDMQIFKPDGSALELDKPIHEQGLTDGTVLYVGDAWQDAGCTLSAAQEAEATAEADVQGATEKVLEAVRWYGQRLAEAADGRSYPARDQPAKVEAIPSHLVQQVREELERDLGLAVGALDDSNLEQGVALAKGKSQHKATEATEDSDGEELILCGHCSLPIGELSYGGDAGEEACLHAECKAQRIKQDLQREEEKRQIKDASVKSSRRKEYDIGWKVERVPRSLTAAKKLNCYPLPQGMCCLLYDEATSTIQLAPTLEPAEAVNLEYLSLALQVRLVEGCEPRFSLDAVDPMMPYTMQRKRFEPSWLQGTSVGEVLFQADYHLKELSMGGYDQPVVGMKSCFDFSEEEGHARDWNAREWFVVRHAEVQLTEDGVLIPQVGMAVEAREQVVGADGSMEDRKVTRPDHPCVKYADAFTHNFDLIAERKSAVFHLRELTKASILAKFLIESGASVEEDWFNLADDAPADCVMEIPQLWNERCYTQIKVGEEALVTPKKHGVYGGADISLDRFRLQVPRRAIVSRPGARVPAAAAIASRPGVRPSVVSAPPVAAVAHEPVRAGVVSRPGVRPSRPSVPRASVVSAVSAPRGVDLNLGEFDLAEATRVSRTSGWGDADACVAMGSAFWSVFDDDSEAAFQNDDKRFLQDLFHPQLSDRRDDGDRFMPPDPSPEYMQALRALVQEEAEVRQQRADHFCSTSFVMGKAGTLFPSSWTVAVEIAKEGPSQGGVLHPRPDYKAETHVLEHLLTGAVPVFDKKTEDAVRFRIYKFGTLEVRTMQEPEGKELIGAVFSVRNSPKKGVASVLTTKGHETVVKVTEYVEKAYHGSSLATQAMYRRYYVVLETEQKNLIVTERLLDGTVAWEENPNDLEDRNSLAKVIRSTQCQNAGITVQDMKSYRDKQSRRIGINASHSKCKLYAKDVYSRCLQLSVDADFRQQAAEKHQGFEYADKKHARFQEALNYNMEHMG